MFRGRSSTGDFGGRNNCFASLLWKLDTFEIILLRLLKDKKSYLARGDLEVRSRIPLETYLYLFIYRLEYFIIFLRVVTTENASNILVFEIGI